MIKNWQTAFLGKGLARRNDPEESHAAAAEIEPKVPSIKAQVLQIIRVSPGNTVSELAILHNLRDPRRVGRRLPELEAAGLVYRTKGICKVTNRPAARWYENTEEK